MSNFLIISHFFAPFSGVGANRMTAVSVYLKNKGNNVFVLKANDQEYGDNVVLNKNLTEGLEVVSLDSNYDNKFLKKIMRVKLYWNKVNDIIKNKHIQVVIISAGPFNYLKIISIIKEKYPNVKCIIDFRDILDGSQCSTRKVSIMQKIGYNVDIRIERKAVEKADMCLTVSEQMNDFYKNRYDIYNDKFICIPNGYDDITTTIDLQNQLNGVNIKKNYKKNAIDIGVFGKYGFYDDKYYQIIAKAFVELKRRGINAKILQFGVREDKFEACFRKYELNDAYKYIPTNGYENDIIALNECSVVIATNFQKEALGTKIFDYIWINRPIITINPYLDGEQAKLTRKFENGYVCNTETEIVNAIEKINKLPEFILDSSNEKKLFYSRSYNYNKLYKYIIDIM